MKGIPLPPGHLSSGGSDAWGRRGQDPPLGVHGSPQENRSRRYQAAQLDKLRQSHGSSHAVWLCMGFVATWGQVTPEGVSHRPYSGPAHKQCSLKTQFTLGSIHTPLRLVFEHPKSPTPASPRRTSTCPSAAGLEALIGPNRPSARISRQLKGQLNPDRRGWTFPAQLPHGRWVVDGHRPGRACREPTGQWTMTCFPPLTSSLIGGGGGHRILPKAFGSEGDPGREL